MSLNRLPCVFMRGGTSKGLIFQIKDLPTDVTEWAAIFLAAMGSPDPYERQLDGMGGGTSSLSKVCVVGPSTHPDADVDYTFAQISVTGSTVDYSGNCGNMSSAIGPYAVEQRLVDAPENGQVCIKIHNTNTAKIIHAHFTMTDGRPSSDGDFVLDGVSGSASPIRLDFIDPAGAKTGKLLPTGNAVDVLGAGPAGEIEASLVDAANPMVFVRAKDLGAGGNITPAAIASDTVLMAKLEGIRCAGSVRMGITATLDEAAKGIALPKIVMIDATTDGEVDIVSRAISVGQPHKAIPLTAALCLAAAVRTPGTLAFALARQERDAGRIVIAHPSGSIVVDAEVSDGGNSSVSVSRASVFRSARRLFDGYVYYAST